MHEVIQVLGRGVATQDPLEHFRGHGPGWKLAALLVIKLPFILPAMAGLVTSVGSVLWCLR